MSADSRKAGKQSPEHLHLAKHGFEACRVPGCGREMADPEDDAICADENCEGSCPAAAYNAWRRRDL